MSFKRSTIIGIVIVVVSLFAVGLFIYQQNVTNTPSKSDKAIVGPAYATLLPTGKSIESLGGWSRVSPPTGEPVFAYTDKIDSVSISISQQPLPESFKSDTTGQVSQLAEKYNATNRIEAGNVAVYIGTSAKGPQSVIFTKEGLLILIKSQAKVDDKAWMKYINTLTTLVVPKY